MATATATAAATATATATIPIIMTETYETAAGWMTNTGPRSDTVETTWDDLSPWLAETLTDADAYSIDSDDTGQIVISLANTAGHTRRTITLTVNDNDAATIAADITAMSR